MASVHSKDSDQSEHSLMLYSDIFIHTLAQGWGASDMFIHTLAQVNCLGFSEKNDIFGV